MNKPLFYIKFFIFIHLFILNSCSKSSNNNATMLNENIHTIDLENITLDKDIKTSLFFNKVKPIILESKDDVVIGKIDNVQFFEDKIYILDRSKARSLFVFTKDGAFLYKIDKVGHGPGEYTYPADFTIDKHRRVLSILDSERRSVLNYSLDKGEFLDAIRLNSNRLCRQIQFNGNSLYIDANNKQTESEYLLHEVDRKTGNDIKSMLDVDEYNKGWLKVARMEDGFFHSRNGSIPKYAQLFMDTVIGIKENSIFPFLVVKSSRWAKKDQLNSIFEASGLIGFFDKLEEKDIVFGITRLAEFDNYITFGIMFGKKGMMQVIYNSKTKETKMCEFILDDLLFKSENMGFLGEICCTTEDGIYTINNLNDSFYNLEESVKRSILKDNTENLEKLITQTSESNPVLFFYSAMNSN